MINLDKKLLGYGKKARLVLQVHDELVVEVGDSIAEEVEQLVVSEMESAVSFSVPLKVDVRRSESWA